MAGLVARNFTRPTTIGSRVPSGGVLAGGGFQRPPAQTSAPAAPAPAAAATPAVDPNAAHFENIRRQREAQDRMNQSQGATEQASVMAMLQALQSPAAAAPPIAGPAPAAEVAGPPSPPPAVPDRPAAAAPVPGVQDGGAGWQAATLGQVGPAGLGQSRVGGGPMTALRALRAHGGLY